MTERSKSQQERWHFMAKLSAMDNDERRAFLSRFAHEHDIPDIFAGPEETEAGAHGGRPEGAKDLAEENHLLRLRIVKLERRLEAIETRLAKLEENA